MDSRLRGNDGSGTEAGIEIVSSPEWRLDRLGRGGTVRTGAGNQAFRGLPGQEAAQDVVHLGQMALLQALIEVAGEMYEGLEADIALLGPVEE